MTHQPPAPLSELPAYAESTPASFLTSLCDTKPRRLFFCSCINRRRAGGCSIPRFLWETYSKRNKNQCSCRIDPCPAPFLPTYLNPTTPAPLFELPAHAESTPCRLPPHITMPMPNRAAFSSVFVSAGCSRAQPSTLPSADRRHFCCTYLH